MHRNKKLQEVEEQIKNTESTLNYLKKSKQEIMNEISPPNISTFELKKNENVPTFIENKQLESVESFKDVFNNNFQNDPIETSYDFARVFIPFTFDSNNYKISFIPNCKHILEKNHIVITNLSPSTEYKYKINIDYEVKTKKQGIYTSRIIQDIQFKTEELPIVEFKPLDFKFENQKLKVLISWDSKEELFYTLIRQHQKQPKNIVLNTLEKSVEDIVEFDKRYTYSLNINVNSSLVKIIPEDLFVFPEESPVFTIQSSTDTFETGQEYTFEIIPKNQFGAIYSNFDSLIEKLKIEPKYKLLKGTNCLLFKEKFDKSGLKTIYLMFNEKESLKKDIIVLAKNPHIPKFIFPMFRNMQYKKKLDFEVIPKDIYGNDINIPLDINVVSKNNNVYVEFQKIEKLNIYQYIFTVENKDLGEYQIEILLNGKIIKEYKGNIVPGPLDFSKTLLNLEKEFIVNEHLNVSFSLFDENNARLLECNQNLELMNMSTYVSISGKFENGNLYFPMKFENMGEQKVELTYLNNRKEFKLNIIQGPISAIFSECFAEPFSNNVRVNVEPKDGNEKEYLRKYKLKIIIKIDETNLEKDYLEKTLESQQGNYEEIFKNLNDGYYLIYIELDNKKNKYATRFTIQSNNYQNNDLFDQNISKKINTYHDEIESKKNIKLLGNKIISNLDHLLYQNSKQSPFNFTTFNSVEKFDACIQFYQRDSAPLWDDWNDNLASLEKTYTKVICVLLIPSSIQKYEWWGNTKKYPTFYFFIKEGSLEMGSKKDQNQDQLNKLNKYLNENL